MKMRLQKLILLIASLIILTACVNKHHVKDTGKPVICVTIEPQRYFTEAIAGDKFEVKSIVPKGMSPESYDPTPQQLIEISQSVAYFRIGQIGFELTWLERIRQNNPQLPIIDTSKGVNMVMSDHKCSHNDGHNTDPHIWTSTVNAQIIAKNSFKALSEIDPENKTYYQARYEVLLNDIVDTDKQIKDLFESHHTSQSFIIYHPSLTYFAHDYHLTQLCIENEGKEPTPKQIRTLIDKAKEDNVRVIFIQPEFDKKNSEVIAKSTQAKIVPISPLNYHWEKEMINIAEAIAGLTNEDTLDETSRKKRRIK